MFKNREIVLYFLTAFLCAFVDDLRILPAIVGDNEDKRYCRESGECTLFV